MAESVILNHKLLVDGYDLSGSLNAINLDYSSELLDVSTMGDTFRRRIGGPKLITASHSGYWMAGPGQVNDVLYDRIGMENAVVTVIPQPGTTGSPFFSFRAVTATYEPGASYGEVLAFNTTMEPTDSPLIEGTVLHDMAVVNARMGDIGPVFRLGATEGVTRAAYAVIHVVSVTGSTPLIGIQLQSSDDENFDTFTSRYSSGGITTPTAMFVTPTDILGVSSAAEEYWRVRWILPSLDTEAVFFVGLVVRYD